MVYGGVKVWFSFFFRKKGLAKLLFCQDLLQSFSFQHLILMGLDIATGYMCGLTFPDGLKK